MLDPAASPVDLPAALAQFASDGYARLGRHLAEPAAAALRRRVDELMAGEVVHSGLFFQLDSPTGRYEDLHFGKGWQGPSDSYRKLEKLEKDPLFFAWMSNPLFEQIARALVGEEVALYRAVLFSKSTRGGTALPWHQDGGAFWGVDRDPTLQIWTALDDCPVEAGCLQVVPGSHRGGLTTPQGGVIPDEHLRAGDAERRALALPARAGDVMLVHNHLWHRSGVNQSGRPRRALSVCFMSAATRCRRTRRTPRTFLKMFG